LTVLAAVLPLSGSGWSVLRGSTSKPTDLRASRLAMLKDSGVPGEGAPSEGPAASKAANRPSSSDKAKGSGQTNDPNAAQPTSGKGRPGGSRGPGRTKSGAPGGKSSPPRAGATGKQGPPQDQAQTGDQAKSEDGRSQDQAERGKEANPDDKQAKSQDSRTEDQAERGKEANPDDENAPKPKDENSSRANPNPRDAANLPSRLPSLSFQAPSWLRTLIIAAGVLVLVFGLYRYREALFHAIWDLLASLLGGLWIPRRTKRAKGPTPSPSEPTSPTRPFASFADPFDSGLAQRLSPNDLVVYSFEALEAWAAEHNLARSSHETPIEFVHRLGQARADLRPDAKRLIGFFVPIVYGQQGFQAEVLPPLRQFWRTLQILPP
jgi:hypothetical protein